jgi:hypothetical protein
VGSKKGTQKENQVMTLLELCYNKPDLILLDSTNCLVRAQLQHYKHLTPEKLRFRLLRLFQALVKSIEVNSCDEMDNFMEKVSDERYESGYELHEVQTAINIMEECLWKKISEFVFADQQIAAMKQVTCILSRAKDALANEYALLSREYIFD